MNTRVDVQLPGSQLLLINTSNVLQTSRHEHKGRCPGSQLHSAVHTFKHCFFPYSELGSDAIQKVLMLSVGVDLIGQCYSMLSVGVDLIGQCYSMLSVSRGPDWSMLFDAIRKPWI